MTQQKQMKEDAARAAVREAAKAVQTKYPAPGTRQSPRPPPAAGAGAGQPVRLLTNQYGDPTFAEVLRRLRCQRCKREPAPVYLCAGHREHNNGPAPDWVIKLVPPR